ncbi:MAG TPA: hypothetical protein VLI39_07780 [Sedimentisphaerales bacterium]|nr:hypothetical protein [Sedimentisphaerales bacterium]
MRKWMVATVASTAARAGEFVWLEGESGRANVKVNNAGWGNAQFLSEGQWMHISFEADKVEDEVKADAVVVQYRFEIGKAARYEVWGRIGFEFARSPFEYRIDSGSWKAVSPDDLTTDLMEIAFFCEVAWLHMGDAQLAAGEHSLEIRIPKVKDKDGKPQRILYACDAICLSEGPFHPNSKHKPGQTGRDEKDETAARNVFRLPDAPAGERSSVSLKGLWEVTRDDEQMPGEVAEPIKALPEVAFFKAIDVPSDKNVSRSDLLFSHRIWYRTKVHVPVGLAGRSFYLDFPQNSLNTTVFVNGVYCGFEKNPFCQFQIDVTKGVKPGQSNEVWVGIRDAWYGRTADPDRPLKLRRTFNTPLKFFHDGFQDLDYPIWNSPQSGILRTPRFVAAGGVYASDVFVKPLVDQYEAEIARCHDAVMAADPTRSVMIDGGGAMKDNTLAVHGDHYVATLDVRYPDLAYEPFVEGGGRGRWKWDMARPRYIGEDFYANGINPADYAMWGGEIAFQGKAATKDAVAICYRMLQEGYRWGGFYAGWHFWLGGEGGERSRLANAPRAVFVRQWDWTFGSGQTVTRTFGLFNDTQYADTMTFTRLLTVDGKDVYRKISRHDVRPGTSERFDEAIPLPRVDGRKEGELVLTISVGGKEVFRDAKSVSVLPVVTIAGTGGVAVYDPEDKLKAFFDGVGVACLRVSSLENLPQTKVLIVAPDALSEADCTSTALAVFASSGRAVIVLDQTHVLKYQALPAEMEPAERTRRNDFGTEIPAADGKTAFIEDSSHPAFHGLLDKDFFTWPGDHRVYRNAYVKPVRGAKSLIQVGPRLTNSAVVEVPVGKGVLYLCQLAIGAKLDQSAVAQTLLANLVEHARNYRQEVADVSAVIDNEQLGKAMDAIGVQYDKAADVLSAIGDPDKKIAVISATPAHLKTLAANMGKLEAFWSRGGSLLFHGLTPEGLADYNKIVGFDHVIRKFKRERVTFPVVRDPLTSGLTTGDIVMLSGQRIFGWTADEYVASDVFTYIVDIDEMAPFATSTFSGWDNMTNGFVGSDGWPLIMDFGAPADGSPYEFKIRLPHEETVVEYVHDQSVNYNPTGSVTLLFDGRDPVKFDLTPDGDRVSCPIHPPRKAREITVRLGGYEFAPGKARNIGMDNIWIRVRRRSCRPSSRC